MKTIISYSMICVCSIIFCTLNAHAQHGFSNTSSYSHHMIWLGGGLGSHEYKDLLFSPHLNFEAESYDKVIDFNYRYEVDCSYHTFKFRKQWGEALPFADEVDPNGQSDVLILEEGTHLNSLHFEYEFSKKLQRLEAFDWYMGFNMFTNINKRETKSLTNPFAPSLDAYAAFGPMTKVEYYFDFPLMLEAQLEIPIMGMLLRTCTDPAGNCPQSPEFKDYLDEAKLASIMSNPRIHTQVGMSYYFGQRKTVGIKVLYGWNWFDYKVLLDQPDAIQQSTRRLTTGIVLNL